MLVLIIGDTHIPDRAREIPLKLVYLIERDKPWDIVVFTGDLTGEHSLNWIKGLGKRLFVVRGNMDYLPLPKSLTFSIEGLNIGIHHGDGVFPRGDSKGLAMIAKQLNVDVLLSGHTHTPFVKTGGEGSVLLLNPGSLTGVWGGGGGSMKPSFMVLSAYRDELEITLHQLVDEEVFSRKFSVRRINAKWVYE